MAKRNGNGGPAPDMNSENMRARQAVLASSINRYQQIFSQTYSTNIAGTVINIPIRNVGLLKRFLVRIDATFARSASETHTITEWGPANILSQIVLTDLSNQTRINTTGWHMHALATARRQRPYGSANVNDSPIDFGSNFTVISAPSSFTTGTQTIRMYYEIPVTYGDFDLRGGIWASVVNATMNLQLTINSNFSVSSTGNPVQAVYQSNGSDLAALSSLTVTVYQNYLDQLPYTANGPVLPMLDLSTAYLLNNTVFTGLSANQDLAMPYANFRSFMSTLAIYDNAGVLNNGSDITDFKLETANYTNIFEYTPIEAALFARNLIGDDFPLGSYYFDHRNKPIETIQYGNMQLVMTPSAVSGATSQILVGYEAFALINMITSAGSLANT